MKEPKVDPYLSVVSCSRNDNYGGGLLARTQAFVTGLLESLDAYQIESEFILVEWNPPPDSLSLSKAIIWPNSSYCSIRLIKVPPSIHQRYRGHEKLAIHGPVAFNVGIRRAKGEFVLPAPIDLLYSDELMSFFASKSLRHDRFYRTERIDVDDSVIQCPSPKERLEYCKNHIIKRHTSNPSMTRRLPIHLHTNASGDFMLMTRESWRRSRGFYEKDIGGMHVDSLLCYMAHASGLRQEVLSDPIRLYHINHGRKQRLRVPPLIARVLFNMPFNRGKPYHRLLRSLYTVPQMTYPEFVQLSRDITDGKRPYALNDEGWGLGNEALNEKSL